MAKKTDAEKADAAPPEANRIDGAPSKAEPDVAKDGTLKQAWTDDATGKTYMPGETLEGDDGD